MGTPTSGSETTLRISRSIAAPRDKVFAAWTRPEALKRWFGPNDDYTTPIAEVDLRVGGRYRIAMQSPGGKRSIVGGTYREVRAPERLAFTWAWEDSPDMPETLVTVEFHDRGGETEVVVIHERFPNEAAREEHNKGWIGCLGRLPKAV